MRSLRWLREVCEAPIVFITGYTDRDTVERIHEQVPGAPVLPKPVYGDRLAAAVAAVTTSACGEANALEERLSDVYVGKAPRKTI